VITAKLCNFTHKAETAVWAAPGLAFTIEKEWIPGQARNDNSLSFRQFVIPAKAGIHSFSEFSTNKTQQKVRP